MFYIITYILAFIIITYLFVRYNESQEVKNQFAKSFLFTCSKKKNRLFSDMWIHNQQVKNQTQAFVEDDSIFMQAMTRLQKKFQKKKR
jgi:hypothetical protein